LIKKNKTKIVNKKILLTTNLIFENYLV